MWTRRSAFSGGDQGYLKSIQYSDSQKLSARAKLHKKHRTASVEWFPWLASLGDIQFGMSVVDVGCGPGWFWAEGRQAVADGIAIVLTDISRGMVREAVERVASLSGLSTSLTGAVADAQQLPFADHQFDIVFASHVMYHVPDPRLAVDEIHRVLKPGGRAVISTNGDEHLKEMWVIREAVFGPSGRDDTTEVFSRTTGRPVVANAFEKADWHQYEDWLDVTNPQGVFDFICSSPPAESADEEQRADLRRVIGEHFDRGHGRLRVTKDSGAFVCSTSGNAEVPAH